MQIRSPAPVVFQRVFAFTAVSIVVIRPSTLMVPKRANYVGCGVVIEDIMHGYRLDTSCSIFTAEAVAVYRALRLIDSTMRINTASILTAAWCTRSALERATTIAAIQWYVQYSTLRVDSTARVSISCFCWLTSHVGIIGQRASPDSAAKSATTHLPLASVPLSDMKRVIMHHIFLRSGRNHGGQQLDNKLHSVKPVIGAWSVMPMRRTDVKLTRLRIGHTASHTGICCLENVL
ncbi:RNase H domain-containing protein [Trichonephila clavipes]|nr:RNase H domain-containing protein [Trichonephila clavipes]